MIGSKKTFIITLLLFFTLITAFFFTRVSFLYNGMDWQDGNGHLLQIFFQGTAPGPHFFYRAQIDGVKYLTAVRHPAIPYMMVSLYGSLARGLGYAMNPGATLGELIITAKIFFWIFFFSLFFSLTLSLFTLEKLFSKFLVFLFSFLILFLPITLQSSREFQLDSSFGIICLIPFALIALFEKSVKRVHWLVCLGGIACAIGKNEWTLALLFGVVIYFVLTKAFKMPKNMPLVLHFLGGLLIGNLLSLILYPESYLAGWGVFIDIFKSFTLVHDTTKVSWETRYHIREKFIIPIMSSIVFSLYIQFRYLKNHVTLLLISLSTGMLICFYLNSWGDDSRYFVPSFFLACISVVRSVSLDRKKILLPFFILMLTFAGPMRKPQFESRNTAVIDQSRSECVWLMDVVETILNPNVNFIHSSLTEGEINDYLKRHSKILCRPTYSAPTL